MSHSKHDGARGGVSVAQGPPCHLSRCPRVRIGQCTGHRACRFGLECRNLRRRQCPFYHPPDHFDATDGIPLPNSNFSIQTKDVLNKLHFKPSRSNHKWNKTEDAVILKYLTKYPLTYCRKKEVAEIEQELKHQRSAKAIKGRLRFIASQQVNETNTERWTWDDDANTSNNNNNGDSNTNEVDMDIESDDESSSSDELSTILGLDSINKTEKNNKSNTSNNPNDNQSKDIPTITPIKKEAITVFDKLCRYYLVDQNHFDHRNVRSSLMALRECDGEEKEVRSIMLNPLSFFEGKVTEFEAKYGAIDLEMEQTIIRQMESTKALLQRTIQNIDTVIDEVKGKMTFGRESEFKEITGYDLEYFQNIVSSINAPKCTVSTVEPPDLSTSTVVRRAVRRPTTPKKECDETTETTKSEAVTVKTEPETESTKDSPALTPASCDHESDDIKQEPPDNEKINHSLSIGSITRQVSESDNATNSNGQHKDALKERSKSPHSLYHYSSDDNGYVSDDNKKHERDNKRRRSWSRWDNRDRGRSRSRSRGRSKGNRRDHGRFDMDLRRGRGYRRQSDSYHKHRRSRFHH